MADNNDVRKVRLGTVTAYKYAKNAGYEGTEAEFAEGLKDSAECADNAAASASAAADSASAADGSAKDAEAYVDGKRGGVDVDSSDPAYHNNAKYYKDQAATSATNAGTSESNALGSSRDAEAYAKGTRNGSAVDSDDPAYHNSSKYWADQASDTVSTAIESIQNEGTTQIGLVTAKGTEQVGAVADKGAEVLASIPSDYTALTEEVALNVETIPNTVQTYTFTDGTVTQVTHTNTSNAVVRTDVFTYGSNTITEVRTLANGDSLTIVTNLTTLETTITFDEAA